MAGAASEDLFADGFESGGFSAWSSSVTDGGELSVTGAAALEVNWGMHAVTDDNIAIYVTDQTPQDKTSYNLSFRYDPNSIGMGSSNLFTLLAGYLDDGSLAFELQQYYTSGSRKLRAVLYLDSGSTSATSYYTITDASHTVQIEWQAATGAGANNGSLKLTIDGQLKQTLSGKDNHTRQVDYLRLGAVAGVDSSTRGTLYLDDFRSWDPTAAVQAEFRYDGDGRRVQSVVNGVTTAFIGQYFEWTGSMKKYYYFGAQRVAVRDGNGTGTTGLSWLLTDHLGSTTIALDAAGTKNAEKRYRPWGEERFSSGTLPTQYTYTGQYSHAAQFGLVFFNARWFDPLLGRFNSPDSIIPEASQGVQAWDRYAGMNNNPINRIDPTGHWSFTISYNISNLVNSALNFVGLSGSQVAKGLDALATTLDTVAMAIDSTIAAGDVASAAIGGTAGAGIAAPEGGAPAVVTGPSGALLGMGLFELSPEVRLGLVAGNALASVSTGITALSDIISGESNDTASLTLSNGGIHLSHETTIGRDTMTSGALSALGWISLIGLTSAPLQGAALLNDIGGLYSGPLRNVPRSIPIRKEKIDIDWD